MLWLICLIFGLFYSKRYQLPLISLRTAAWSFLDGFLCTFLYRNDVVDDVEGTSVVKKQMREFINKRGLEYILTVDRQTVRCFPAMPVVTSQGKISFWLCKEHNTLQLCKWDDVSSALFKVLANNIGLRPEKRILNVFARVPWRKLYLHSERSGCRIFYKWLYYSLGLTSMSSVVFLSEALSVLESEYFKC